MRKYIFLALVLSLNEQSQLLPINPYIQVKNSVSLMKRLDIYVPYSNVSEVTMVLHKHDIGGMTLSDVRGRGKIPHTAIPEVVSGEWHTTGKRIVPEYIQRSLISAIMQESEIKPLIDDLRKISVERGKVFVSDVTEAYDLSSGEEGENAL